MKELNYFGTNFLLKLKMLHAADLASNLWWIVDLTSTLAFCHRPRVHRPRALYTSETIVLSSTLKPKGYELLHLPYHFYCPSEQQKIKRAGGNRYQCETCFRLFTTLTLASKHIISLKYLCVILTRRWFVRILSFIWIFWLYNKES